jgi:hypothetical protein
VKGRDYLGDLDVDGTFILKLILKAVRSGFNCHKTVQGLALVNRVLKHWLPQREEIKHQLSDYQHHEKEFTPCRWLFYNSLRSSASLWRHVAAQFHVGTTVTGCLERPAVSAMAAITAPNTKGAISLPRQPLSNTCCPPTVCSNTLFGVCPLKSVLRSRDAPYRNGD